MLAFLKKRLGRRFAGRRAAKRNPFVPPEATVFVGKGDFEAIGNEFLNIFLTYGGLRPTDHVLDVGAGQGRMALPLTRFLSPEGSYTGIEVVKRGVEWCQNAYRAFPNFTFLHADVYNRHYNPGGTVEAGTYEFPFAREQFDFIFLTSVFTHMRPGDVGHYMAEISRCLKPGGRSLITYFILQPESLREIAAGEAGIKFQFPVFDACMTTQQEDPEAAVAYPESFIRECYDATGQQIVGDIHYGGWAHTPQALTFQDLVIARKA